MLLQKLNTYLLPEVDFSYLEIFFFRLMKMMGEKQ
jgi:hypothetical protein